MRVVSEPMRQQHCLCQFTGFVQRQPLHKHIDQKKDCLGPYPQERSRAKQAGTVTFVNSMTVLPNKTSATFNNGGVTLFSIDSPKRITGNSAWDSGYLIFDSRNMTCLRARGSYFLSSNFSGFVRGFFFVT